MFVLMECWRSLQAGPGDRSLEDRIGTVVSQAGVSICVTSLTDVLAFCLGATTVAPEASSPPHSCISQIMPGLRSFCLTAAICIGFIFLLQVTTISAITSSIGFYFTNIYVQVSWFVAWLTLDQKRLKSKRLGLAPCFTLKKVLQLKVMSNSTARIFCYQGDVPKTDKRQCKIIFNGLAKLLEHIIFKVKPKSPLLLHPLR